MAVSELSSVTVHAWGMGIAGSLQAGKVVSLSGAKVFGILVLTALPFFAQADVSDPAVIDTLRREGQIWSLMLVLETVRPITQGHILEVEVDNVDHDPTYEIFYLDQNGSRQVIYVIARTGQVLAHKPSPVKP